MIIYYIFIFFFALFNSIDAWGLKKSQKTILINFFSICLILFAGLRLDNADYDVYSEAYLTISNGEFVIPDMGFNLIIYLMNFISHHPITMFLTIAYTSVCINFNSFKKYSPYIFTTILLYFVHNYVLKEMIQIRAGLASSICLFSIRYIVKEDYKKTIWTWILALTIHSTTIIFGLFILIYKLKPSKKTIIYVLIISLIIGHLFPFGSIIKSIANIGVYSSRLEAYVMYGDSGYASKLGVFTNINTIKSLIICCFFLYFYDRFNRKYIYFKPMFLSYAIGLCWLICFNDFAIIGARMSNIVMCTEPILLTLPFSLFKRESRIMYALILILFSGLIFYYNIGESKVTPYKFYF